MILNRRHLLISSAAATALTAFVGTGSDSTIANLISGQTLERWSTKVTWVHDRATHLLTVKCALDDICGTDLYTADFIDDINAPWTDLYFQNAEYAFVRSFKERGITAKVPLPETFSSIRVISG